MIRSRVVRFSLAAILAFGAVLVASASAGAATALSPGCAMRHSQASQTFATPDSVFLTPQQYARGEQLTFVGTTDPGVALKVNVNYPSENVQTLSGSSGAPIRFSVPFDTGLSFLLTSDPKSSVSWRIDCALPPTAAISSPVDGQTFTVGREVATSYACTEETNPVASCVDSHGDGDGSGVLDTSALGDHTYTVTATDSTGLSTTTSVSYTVAPKKAQTISFAGNPPYGVDWFFGDLIFGYGYLADATATSGLPVAYSIAPASAGVCRIERVLQADPWLMTGAVIEFLGAGTCTINADQAGDDEYLPAGRVSQSFEIGKVQTWLTAAKAGKGVLGLTPSTFSATLSVPVYAGGGGWSTEGYAGQPITFAVAGKTMCTAITNASGVATCKAPIGLASWTNQSSYTATYTGDANYLGVSAVGKLGG
jgi:hypothetical protein